jgi:hypothetical protein
MLDLPAAGAGQVAGEQRLQLHDERELVLPAEFVLQDVAADAQALAERHGH